MVGEEGVGAGCRGGYLGGCEFGSWYGADGDSGAGAECRRNEGLVEMGAVVKGSLHSILITSKAVPLANHSLASNSVSHHPV